MHSWQILFNNISMKKTLLSLFLVSISFFALGQDSFRSLEADSLQVGDLTRSFLFHKSTNLASKP